MEGGSYQHLTLNQPALLTPSHLYSTLSSLFLRRWWGADIGSGDGETLCVRLECERPFHLRPPPAPKLHTSTSHLFSLLSLEFTCGVSGMLGMLVCRGVAVLLDRSAPECKLLQSILLRDFCLHPHPRLLISPPSPFPNPTVHLIRIQTSDLLSPPPLPPSPVRMLGGGGIFNHSVCRVCLNNTFELLNVVKRFDCCVQGQGHCKCSNFQ